MLTGAAVEVRLATPDDMEGIGRLLPDLAGPQFPDRFPGRTVADFCRWKYYSNPVGHATVGIATEGGQVVSIVAAVPKRVQLGSEIVLAFELGDFITTPEYRKRGLFSSLIRLVCDETSQRGAAFAYVRPNENSFPILNKGLGFPEVEKISESRYVVPSGLIRRKVGISPELSRVLGIDQLARRLLLPSSATSVVVESVNRFGQEMDELWESARQRYSFSLARDGAYLNWRYIDSPTPYRSWIARQNGEATGYVIACMNRSQTDGLIIDLFCDPDDSETAAALLRAGMETLLDAGAQSISTWIPETVADSAGQRFLTRAFPRKTKPPLHMALRFLDMRFNSSPSASERLASRDGRLRWRLNERNRPVAG